MKHNGYQLTRAWFNYAFENHNVRPNDAVLYLWLVELNNRLGWKETFSITTKATMEACGFHSPKQYTKALSNLIEWGFVKMVQKSKNQYQANVIALDKSYKAPGEALTIAAVSALVEPVGEAPETFIKPTNQPNPKPTKREKFAPPVVEDVVKYFSDNGYTEDSAIRAFSYYNTANWVDGKGNPVLNWKQKMISVWFKPENKKPEPTKSRMVY